MNLEDVKVVKTLLTEPKEIVIIPHKNPDGDAMGSCLGLYHFLVNSGHHARVIAPNDYPKFLKWLPGNESVIIFEKDEKKAVRHLKKAEIIFTLDFNHFDRTGQMKSHLESATTDFVMIDHHQEPQEYARVTYSDTNMSSTCEMVFNFLEVLGAADQISEDIANCLYTGIMTDTGSFKYASTTSRTHQVVAKLIDCGAQNTEIHRRIYDNNSPDRLRLLGRALKNMVILEKFRTAYITLEQHELDEHNFKKGDTEGFVNYGLTLEGIHFAAIFIENREEGIIKISFRSVGDFSVNEFARSHFNGGGHTNAAGGRSEDDMKGTIAYFESLLKGYELNLNA
ncbi:DHH family phosphoesterase [Poritiphilus flavus]|uniref:Bifunctional oligoribonuclease/PAP phosphatase NrnA n=1 Tax=Poritiphilus flavus TaxID=2697053 RepID=A0A6L9E9J5_9FLAO|nr:bifunctional oligoribonuclease/PAP phosphatase NrnA [Poritiphilus flavus]NAS11386.1 bifunctional oligoribonuclease/PAP phosphatase NrnA [Poritiphilus flavus]